MPKQKESPGIAITVDGRRYAVRQADLTAVDSMLCRRETGHSFAGLLRAAQDDPDIDVVAAVMWLSRRASGEHALRFAEVAAEVGYDVEITVEDESKPGEDDDPET